MQVAISAVVSTPQDAAFVVEAEKLGAASVWVPEAWGQDALTPLAYLAALTSTIKLASGIVQIGARTPAMLAMQAMSLQGLSNGRLLVGLGTSGPQVMEGWHGIEFAHPIRRTRETIEIVRMITSGERLAYEGQSYVLPLPGGEGRSIRSLAAPAPVPIYVASLGPANLALTGAMADGWIGNSFFPEHADVYFGPIAEAAAAAGRSLRDLDLVVAASVEFTDDVEGAGRRHADGYAFTFGAMGSAASNFYNNAFGRLGFAEDVAEVQRLWAAGDRAAAAARVPIGIGLGTNLIGPPEVVRDRLRAYRDAGVTTLRIAPIGTTFDDHVAGLEQLLELLDTVNRENEEPTDDRSA